ncbi:Seipin [Chionoecetes opilio]|uniref:Seipin n=1 Tax=Chionoecetes opilio TaxID=41210 RepID=A0A8J4XVD3_CHIOP|nr:Seipin [Chionoecetes opilio]
MFLMNMGMKNQGGETLRQASRSSMLRYKSSLLQVISTTVFAPLLLYGLQEEKQLVTVELFSQYEEDPEKQLVTVELFSQYEEDPEKQLVTVELFSQYEEDPVLPLSEVHIELASRHVELYSAQLRVHAMFSGLRYFMFNYPVSAGVVGVGICMVFLSTVVILSWYQFSAPTLSPVQAARPQNMASFPNGSAPSIATLDTTASNTKVEEEKRAAASVSEGELPDQEAAKGQAVKGSSNSSSSEEASRDSARAEKGDRDSARAEKGDRDSPVAEKGDRDDFEMVGPSKVQGAFRRAGEEAGPSCEEEGDSVVRQRVQSVL